MAKKVPFSYRLHTHAPVGGFIARANRSPCRKRLFFLSCSYVCPEPVLGN